MTVESRKKKTENGKRKPGDIVSQSAIKTAQSKILSHHSRLSIPLNSSAFQRIRRNLKFWYSKHARDLPWRRSRDPYCIWISEIMLQQTTVAAVIPYFERFLKRFPSVDKLAEATEEEVLRYWEGLGYYSRARNIHKTARLLVDDNVGRFPEDVDLLRKLPGIGRYTAGAIASFAFDLRAPIVEANTLRLYCRLTGYRGDPRSTDGQRLLWEFAEKILPRKSSGYFNQALMELGGLICTPKEPTCHKCPLRLCCVAFERGLQNEIPVPQRRPEITPVLEAVPTIRRGNRYLLIRRPEGERWAGLWDFPRFSIDVDPRLWHRKSNRKGRNSVLGKIRHHLEQEVASHLNLEIVVKELLTEIRHGVTRYRITLLCFTATTLSTKQLTARTEISWATPDEFSGYPLSVTGRKVAKLLAKRS